MAENLLKLGWLSNWFVFLLITKSTNGASLDDVIRSVSQDVLSVWTHKEKFPSIDSLLLDERSLGNGIAVDGRKSIESVKKMAESAINGQDVNIFVLGGSSTLGADLGQDNLQLTYHFALADWWNKTIGSATGTHIHRKVVAVGGVGTTYFGHCWQEYVNENDKFDYVTWEFAINDPDSLQYDKAVERFTRDVLSMPSRPGLTFVNFVSKSKLASGSLRNCKRHENEAKTVDMMAKHYSSTSIRWERCLCSSRKFKLKKNIDKLFIKNHPKAIAHAQVAYILIKYFQKAIINSLKERKSRQFISGNANPYVSGNDNNLFVNNGIPSVLPEPVFMTKDDINLASKCFTSITPGPWNPPKHTLQSLHILHNNGFTILKESSWDSVPEDRHDATGGYIAQKPSMSLKLKFNAAESNADAMSQISVTVRNKYFGGRVKFILNEGTANEKIVHADTSEKKKAGTNSIELGIVSQGEHTLSVYTETGGCNLCAVIMD